MLRLRLRIRLIVGIRLRMRLGNSYCEILIKEVNKKKECCERLGSNAGTLSIQLSA
jgi:hypothetical protein